MVEKTTSFGPYTMDSFLGQGEDGLAYLAHDPTTGERVMLKVPPVPEEWEEAERFRKRFVAKARAAKPLDHPAIQAVRGAGVDEGSGLPFIACEAVEGQDLRELTTGGRRLADIDIALIGAAVAEALDYAHAAGFVHGKVSPSHIIFGPGGVVKLTGFGLEQPELSPTDLRGQVARGPCYLAPEQVRGETVDSRSDLFSLGIVLFELVTGEHPFAATLPKDCRDRILQDPAPLAGKVRPDAPGGFNSIIFKLLQKEPERRPTRAAEVAESLRALHAKLSEPPSPAQTAGPGRARQVTGTLPVTAARAASGPSPRLLLVVAGALAVVVLAVVAFFLLRPAPQPVATEPAQDPAALRRINEALNEVESALAAGEFLRAERLLTEVFKDSTFTPRAWELSQRVRAMKADKARRLFDEGVDLMRERRFQQAETRFVEVLELTPGDAKAQEYLEAIRGQPKPVPTAPPALPTIQVPVAARLRPTPTPIPAPRLRVVFPSPLAGGALLLTVDGRPFAELPFDFSAPSSAPASAGPLGVVQHTYNMPDGLHHVLVSLRSKEGLLLGEQVLVISFESDKEATIRVEMSSYRAMPRFVLIPSR